MTDSSRRGVRPPKQARSRRTLERIVGTARQLLSERDARDVSLREIADCADVSFSSLFARFASKEVLLDHLHEELCHERLDAVEAVIKDLSTRDEDLETIARAGFEILVEGARERGGLEQTFTSASAQHLSIHQREQRFQEQRFAILRRFAMGEVEAAGLSAREEDLDSVLRLVLAAAPEMLRGVPATEAGNRELVDRLTELALRALGLDHQEVSKPRPILRPVSDPSDKAVRLRILDAAETLFDGRELTAYGLADVARIAALTESDVRTHFAEARGLLHATFERVISKATAWIDQRAVWTRWEGRGLEQLVREAIACYAEGWETWGGVIKTVRAEEAGDPTLRSLHRRLDTEILSRVSALAVRVEPSLLAEHHDREALTRAMATIGAALRAAVDRPSAFALEAGYRNHVLVDELTAVALRYVGREPEARSDDATGTDPAEARG